MARIKTSRNLFDRVRRKFTRPPPKSPLNVSSNPKRRGQRGQKGDCSLRAPNQQNFRVLDERTHQRRKNSHQNPSNFQESFGKTSISSLMSISSTEEPREAAGNGLRGICKETNSYSYAMHACSCLFAGPGASQATPKPVQ